jgi:hypothetical protein
MYPHRIRLRGPWDGEPISPPGPPRTVTLPARLADVGLVNFAGRVRLSRRFGYPGRIDAYEHVWLTFAAVAGRADVVLNGRPLGTGQSGTFEFEVTSLLSSRNRLDVLLDADGGDAGLTGEVALEVRRDAFLRDVTVEPGADGAIRVTGLAVGSSARPLELYVLVDGKNMSYSLVEARADGQPFDVSFLPEGPPQQVRVELVNGAERWYAVDVPEVPR